MKRSTVSGLFLVVVAVVTSRDARADDKAACLDAASRAQKLRNAHQLVEAREQLRVCAGASCPTVVQSDCVGWLADVEKSLPGVVVTAKNGAGADVLDVTVTVDGHPLLTKLTGQATPMNAGPHTFHFEAADGSSLEQDVLVREGLKDQPVSVVLKAPAPKPVPAAAAATPPASTSPSASPLRTVGFVAGGVGAAGLIAGTIAGIVALSDKSGAHCSGNVCQGPVGGVKAAALAADIGFIAGGVLLAGGVGLVLLAPAGKPATTGVRLVPSLTASGGGIAVGGGF